MYQVDIDKSKMIFKTDLQFVIFAVFSSPKNLLANWKHLVSNLRGLSFMFLLCHINCTLCYLPSELNKYFFMPSDC